MLFRGQRQDVPSSRWGTELGVLEAMHWTHEQFMAQPAEMIEELVIRLSKRALIEREKANG